MNIRRFAIAAASLLVVAGAIVVPAQSASAQPCAAWGSWMDYIPQTDEFVVTGYCAFFQQDISYERPEEGRSTSMRGDSGAGGGNAAAEPGSEESCQDVADTITRLQAEIDMRAQQQASLQGDVERRGKDFADTIRALITAINFRQAAESVLAQAKTAAGPEETDLDSRGKPIHQNPAVTQAETRLGMANAQERDARATAAYAAHRLNDVNDQLAAVQLAGTQAQIALEEAIAQQTSEKCLTP